MLPLWVSNFLALVSIPFLYDDCGRFDRCQSLAAFRSCMDGFAEEAENPVLGPSDASAANPTDFGFQGAAANSPLALRR